jgi:hypothetical protein
MGCMVPQPFAVGGNQSYPKSWAITIGLRYTGYKILTSNSIMSKMYIGITLAGTISTLIEVTLNEFITARYLGSDSNLYVGYSPSRPQAECTTTRNPHEGVHLTLQPRFGQLFTPRRVGLQSPNMTVTPAGTTTIRAGTQTFRVVINPKHHVH